MRPGLPVADTAAACRPRHRHCRRCRLLTRPPFSPGYHLQEAARQALEVQLAQQQQQGQQGQAAAGVKQEQSVKQEL